jgi:hypothetical protein
LFAGGILNSWSAASNSSATINLHSSSPYLPTYSLPCELLRLLDFDAAKAFLYMSPSDLLFCTYAAIF